MPLYRDHVYPHLVSKLGDPKPIREIRHRIIPLAQGRVLEIGVGPGANFAHYNPARITKIFALEPSPGMIRLAEKQRAQRKLDVELLNQPGERIRIEDASIDTVVSTFTLCTIPGVMESLAGIRRVLKQGGKLIFFEHGLSPDIKVRQWQERCESINGWLFEGCHLTRDIPSLLMDGGFKIEQMEEAYIAEFPKPWTYCWWGAAIPKSQ
jgi:SAM-dependent methyltransferase